MFFLHRFFFTGCFIENGNACYYIYAFCAKITLVILELVGYFMVKFLYMTVCEFLAFFCAH